MNKPEIAVEDGILGMMPKRLNQRQWSSILISRKHGTVNYLLTRREFGYSRCLTVGNGRDRRLLHSQQIIRAEQYDHFCARGGVYAAGNFSKVIWTGKKTPKNILWR